MIKVVPQTKKLKVCQIYRNSVADGLGLRTVIFWAGCGQDPKCPFCQNSEAWSASSGKEISMDKLISLATQTNEDDITFSGGDPLTFQFSHALEAAKILKLKYNKNIWLYTGYKWEDIIKTKYLVQILPYIDILVDGKFIFKLKDISLKFRGSSNQRIIDVQKSLKEHRIIDIIDQIE